LYGGWGAAHLPAVHMLWTRSLVAVPEECRVSPIGNEHGIDGRETIMSETDDCSGVPAGAAMPRLRTPNGRIVRRSSDRATQATTCGSASRDHRSTQREVEFVIDLASEYSLPGETCRLLADLVRTTMCARRRRSEAA
jgi:hypothetical protein